MTPQDKLVGILYVAWAVLMAVTAVFQREPTARRSHLLGAAGFVVLLCNLFLAHGPVHFLVRLLGLAILAVAAVTYFKGRTRLSGSV